MTCKAPLHSYQEPGIVDRLLAEEVLKKNNFSSDIMVLNIFLEMFSYSKYILNIYIVSHNVFAVHPQSLKWKCAIIRSKDQLYVIPLPNNIERD